MLEKISEIEFIKLVITLFEKVDKINHKLANTLAISIVSFCITLIAIAYFYFFADYNIPNQTIQTHYGDGTTNVDVNSKQ